MGILSAALLAELQKAAPEVYFTLDIGDGAGGQIRACAEPFASRSLGSYRPWIARWGTLTRALSTWRGGLQAATLSADIDDTTGEFTALYGRALRGRAVTARLASPNVEASDYLTWFVGVVDSVGKQGDTISIAMRQDDDPLNTPLTKAPVQANTFSGLPAKGDAVGKGVPYLVGTHDSTGLAALGLIPCPYVDSTNFRYVVSLGWWPLVTRVYVDNVLKVLGPAASGGDYVLTQTLTGDGRKVTLIQFHTDQGAGSVVADVQDSTSPLGAGSCLQQIAVDLAWNDYHSDSFAAASAPIDTTAMTALDTFLSDMGLGRAFYIPGSRLTLTAIAKGLCDSYEVHAHWTLEGKLSVRPWELRTQGDQIYQGPGAPDTTLAARRVITRDDFLSEPRFYQEPESVVTRLLMKSGLRASDNNWINQRTVKVEVGRTAAERKKERASTVEGPWLPPSAATIGTIAYLSPDGTTLNTGWSVTGAGSAHAALAQDPLTPASGAQYVRATGVANLRLSLSAMPSLTGVQAVTVWVELLADGPVLSTDDDTLDVYVRSGGVDYPGYQIVGGGVYGSIEGEGYQRYFGGRFLTDPNGPQAWTQGGLNALEVGFGWDPQSTVGKAMRCRLLSVFVDYTASADITPAPVSVASRRVHRYRTAPNLLQVQLPLWALDYDLGADVVIADPREGWPNTVTGRRNHRVSTVSIDASNKRVSHIMEGTRLQLTTCSIDCKALVGVDSSSAAGDGMGVLTHGGAVSVVRASPKYVDSPAGIDVQDAGPVEKILANTCPSERRGMDVERQRQNELTRSSFISSGTGLTPSAGSGTITYDATVGEQLFRDAAVSAQHLLFTAGAPHAVESRVTWAATASLTTFDRAVVSIDYKGSSTTANDGPAWRLVRNADGFYWNDTTGLWQAGAVDNPLAESLTWTRSESKLIDVGATKVKTFTFSVSLPAGGTASRTARIGHVQLEQGHWATSRIPTEAAVAARSADQFTIENDKAGYYLWPPDRGTWRFIWVPKWSSVNVPAGTQFYFGAVPYDANNRWEIYYEVGVGFVFKARSGGVNVTVVVNVAIVKGTEYHFWPQYSSSVEDPANVLTLTVDDGTTVTTAESGTYVEPVFAAGKSMSIGCHDTTANLQCDGYLVRVRNSPHVLAAGELEAM